jgi:hypothetical protein
MTKRDLIPRIGRCWLLIQEFDFDVQYRPGKKMTHVDALSRNSVQGVCKGDEDKHHIFHLNLNEDDSVLAAQLQDETCKRLHTVLMREPTDSEGKRIHDEYTLKQNRVHEVTPDGLRWVVPKTAPPTDSLLPS